MRHTLAETPLLTSEPDSDPCREEHLRARPTAEPFWLRVRGAMVLAPCALLLLAAFTRFHHSFPVAPCSMRVEYGLPCPTCGMTRSVEAMAEGAVGRAVALQPFGVVLFAGCVFFGTLGAMELVTGLDVIGILRPSGWWVLYGLGGLLAGWLWVLLTGLISGQLPMT